MQAGAADPLQEGLQTAGLLEQELAHAANATKEEGPAHVGREGQRRDVPEQKSTYMSKAAALLLWQKQQYVTAESVSQSQTRVFQL